YREFLTFIHNLVSTSFKWTPHAKAHSNTEGAEKFALTVIRQHTLIRSENLGLREGLRRSARMQALNPTQDKQVQKEEGSPVFPVRALNSLLARGTISQLLA
ncbi:MULTISPECIES: hypothetical protein, partial [unclassified Neorhizobium]|uniref:hypothetical protein n=1 Tax=unclassified Neorhizobium TaxID=2629175 RepID=UPI001FF17C0A